MNHTTDENTISIFEERKLLIAKKISALMVLEASITADIVSCRKNDDIEYEEKLSDIQENLNDIIEESVEAFENFDSLTESEINAFEAKVNEQGMSALKAKLTGAVKNFSKEKKKEEGKKYTINSVRISDPYGDSDDPREKAKRMVQADKYKHEQAKKFHKSLEEIRKKNSLEDIRKKKEAEEKEKSGVSKLRNIFTKCGDKLNTKNKDVAIENAVDECISNGIKYSHMITEFCKRYDSGLITYESTIELIDSVYDRCI